MNTEPVNNLPPEPIPTTTGSNPPVPAAVTPLAPAMPPKAPAPTINITQTPITRAPDAKSDGETMDRRTFIKWASVGWAAFIAVVAGYGTLVLRFFFPNVLFEPKQSFLAGYPNDYVIGEVSERWKAEHGVWIVRESDRLYALSTVCTHLGCTPNWLPNESKYKCPCHGSGFYKTGINFEGPAPRPLERFKIIVNDSGEILVDKTQKFQQEKGEWSDPDSFILA